MEIIDVNKDNVDETGFFCCMSKRKSAGYQRKLRWLKARFDEGLKIKMLELPARGFIEYIPGEHAWRPVDARGYIFIHCLWVVGKSKGRGYATRLLDECLRDARTSGMKGVAMVTSEGNWLAGKRLLEMHGFESVDHAPPSFELMARKFGRARSPSLAGGWEAKQRKAGKGITIFRSDQCPYLEDATNAILDAADELGLKSRVVEIESSEEIRRRSPSAYGVFGTVCDGALLGTEYMLKKEVLKRLRKR